MIQPDFKCSICIQLKDKNYSFKKYGSEEETMTLPPAAGNLIVKKNLNPGSARVSILKQCPECGTYYFYETDYEYLVNGSEDEEFLTRLSDKEADEYL